MKNTIMKTSDLLKITTVALGTAVATVATFWSGPIDAGVDAAEPVHIVQPKLVAHGMELHLTYPGKAHIQPGERPEFQLAAVNLGDTPAIGKFRIAMSATEPRSLLSRTLATPQTVWEKVETFTLKAHETRKVALAIDRPILANMLMSVSINDAAATDNASIPSANVLTKDAVQSLVPDSVVAFTFSTVSNQTSSLLPQPAAAIVRAH